MTSTTPEHNIPQCHAASEDRRQLLCRLKCLAERLDEEPPVCDVCDEALTVQHVLLSCRRYSGTEWDSQTLSSSWYPQQCAGGPGNCDKAALKAAGCGDLFSKGRQVYPNPADAPLITYPENSERGEYKMKIPPRRSPWELPRVKSKELIAGYIKKNGCDCVRRNGLQDSCELSQCQGRPLCLTTPVPLCPPSGGAGLLVTPEEAAAIVDKVDADRCCRLSCCPGLMTNC